MKSLNSILFVIMCVLFFSASGNAQQWVIYNSQNSPLKGTAIEIIIDSANSKWIATDQGLVRFKNNEWTIWDTTNSGLTTNRLNSIAKDNENNIWVGTLNDGVFKFDGVSNWKRYYYTNTGRNLIAVQRIRVDNENTVWVCSFVGLFKHIINDHWIRYCEENSEIPNNTVNDLLFEGNIKWVGTKMGGVGKFDDTSWTTYNVFNSPLLSNVIERVAIDRYKNKWLTTTFGGVAKFNSQQNQWTIFTSANSGLPYDNTFAIFIDNLNTKWIGIQGGGCVTYNDTVWNFLLISLETASDFKEDKYGNIWICIGGLYVYNPNGVIGIENISNELPYDCNLYQNYPNPFNPTTNINYTISKNCNVKLKVYNILGKEITTLINQKQNSGNYQITFDAKDLPSGIYFYELTIDNTSRFVKKMILIK